MDIQSLCVPELVCVSPEALLFVVTQARVRYLNHGGVETGGVLTGNVSGRLWEVQKASGSFGGFETPVTFERGMEGLPEYLEAEEAMGRHYIGEWHSHPKSPAAPSMIDQDSHSELAKMLGEPLVCMIVGGDFTRAPLEQNADLSVSIFDGEGSRIEYAKGGPGVFIFYKAD